MLSVKNAISFTNRYMKENVKRHIIALAIVFLVVGIGVFFIVTALPDETLYTMHEKISEVFANKDVENADGTLSFFGIFRNNVQASAITSLTGLIPFLFLPAWSIGLNSAVVAALLGILHVLSDNNVILLFIKYIIPHGIFEIPAIIIAGAIGTKFCLFLCRKICGRAKGESVLLHIKGCIGVFVFYVIPLLLIAAFIEAVVLTAVYA